MRHDGAGSAAIRCESASLDNDGNNSRRPWRGYVRSMRSISLAAPRGDGEQIRPGGNRKGLGDHTPNMDVPCEVQRCAVQFRNVAHTAKWGSFVPVKKQRCGEMYYVSRRLDRRSKFIKDLRKRKDTEKPRRRSRENSMRKEAEGCKSTSDRRKRSGSMSHLSKASGCYWAPSSLASAK
jgi:hypothetical protein